MRNKENIEFEGEHTHIIVKTLRMRVIDLEAQVAYLYSLLDVPPLISKFSYAVDEEEDMV